MPLDFYTGKKLKISSIRTTPLLVPYKNPYHWAQGVIDGATVILIEVESDSGLIGYGESIGSPSAEAIELFIAKASDICRGRNPLHNARLMTEVYQGLFRALGTCSSPRFCGQVLAGLEMALWDLAGKACGLAAHEMLGGAVRDEIGYFGFAQGESAQQTATEAKELADSGCEVIYFKVGRGDAFDLEMARQVRAAIGPRKRLRMDPNENWSPLRAASMIRKMAEFDVEFIEQPSSCESISALAQIKSSSEIAIAADQAVFTPYDTFDVCRQQAADLIVLGLHETGGLLRLAKSAHIAEAADINICIHGLYETGITTCAANQVAATISNLDDGNQYMNHFLSWDIVKSPDLALKQGKLPVLNGPGLGFELDWNAVEEAKKLYQSLQH